MGSDKSKHKSKKSKHKSDKRRKRTRSPDSDTDVSKQVRRLEKSHKQAQGVPHHAAIDDEVINAYGDSNLEHKFFWKKKVEKDVKSKKVDAPAAARERDRQEELERVRTKRCAHNALCLAPLSLGSRRVQDLELLVITAHWSHETRVSVAPTHYALCSVQ
jgi:hypothetical protein